MKKGLMLAIAMIMGVTFAASAEMSDLKISGSVDTYMVNLDVDLGGPGASEKAGFISAVTTLRFDADLTEDVSTVIEFFNERFWGENSLVGNDEKTDVIKLHKAYVQMKDFLSMPATLTLGRQVMDIGSGLVMGSGSESHVYAGTMADCWNKKGAVDGIRLKLDYDPIMIDLFYQKWTEGEENVRTDDVNYYGVDVEYALSDESNVAAYAYFKDQGGNDDFTDGTLGVYGVRTKVAASDNIDLRGEFAYQTNGLDGDGTEKQAYVLDLGMDYKLLDDKNTKICLTYQYASGDKVGTAKDESWYEMRGGLDLGTLGGMFTNSNSNVELFLIGVERDIREDIKATATYRYIRSAKYGQEDSAGSGTYTDGNTGAMYTVDPTNHSIGSTLDLGLTYDYTEDVKFGLDQGFFFPSGYFGNDDDQPAYATTASVKVSF